MAGIGPVPSQIGKQPSMRVRPAKPPGIFGAHEKLNQFFSRIVLGS